jgi:hypothetical protein
MRGQYKVKSEELKPLFERAKKMSQTLEAFRIEHVYREQNREADALVNQALDETSRAGATGGSSTAKLPPKDSSMRFFARYKDGALHPEDALNLPDGTDVEVIIRLRK